MDNKIFPDISHYEPCDFKTPDFTHLITKATDGSNFVDPTFRFNRDQCANKIIRFGCYHFYRVQDDAIEQAKHYIDVVGLENLKNFFHLPILDYETASSGKKQSEQDMKDHIPEMKKWILYVYNATGRKVRVYTYETLLAFLQLDAEFFLKYCDLPWLARYGRRPIQFSPWSNMWAWQFSDGEYSDHPTYNDKFSGIGRCDANIFI